MQVSHLDSRNYTTPKRKVRGHPYILTAEILTDLNTSRAAHLFSLSSNYHNDISVEGKSAPRFCELWSSSARPETSKQTHIHTVLNTLNDNQVPSLLPSTGPSVS